MDTTIQGMGTGIELALPTREDLLMRRIIVHAIKGKIAGDVEMITPDEYVDATLINWWHGTVSNRELRATLRAHLPLAAENMIRVLAV